MADNGFGWFYNPSEKIADIWKIRQSGPHFSAGYYDGNFIIVFNNVAGKSLGKLLLNTNLE